MVGSHFTLLQLGSFFLSCFPFANYFYKYVHRKILTLPHASSIASWTSTVNAEPGFLTEVLAAIGTFPDCDRDVSLVIDAMYIKKGKIWDQKMQKFVGLVDFGNAKNTSSDAEATQALFFLLVALNGKWRLPIAYFLINTITAACQGELIKTALTLTDEKCVRVRSITFDGAAVNLSTAKYLGKSCESGDETDFYELDLVDDADELEELFLLLQGNDEPTIENQIPYYFDHPKTKNKVFIILDPSHMAKLARNTLGNTCILYLRYS